MENTPLNTIIDLVKHQLLSANYDRNEIRAITHIILKKYLDLNTAEIYINLNKKINTTIKNKIEKVVDRLKNHEPLQHILGQTEFYDITLFVNNNVLIPRPETEELVNSILSDYKHSNNLTILDIGTGSGAIAITLAKHLNGTQVYALDISGEALCVAKKNAKLNHVSIKFIKDDILNAAIYFDNKFDCIVSNPPYVRNSEKTLMNKNVLVYEPHNALFVDDNNPLVFYEAIAKTAKNNLNANGVVYVEINEALPNETEHVFQKYGFKTVLKNDINNKPRMIKAQWIKS